MAVRPAVVIQILLIASGIPVLAAAQAVPTPAPAPSVILRVVTATMTQIVLRWEDTAPGALSYEVQRDTDPGFSAPQAYLINRHTANFRFRVFSDTDRFQLDNRKQLFSGHPWGGPLLERETDYYYRVRTIREGGTEEISNAVTGWVSGPVRGRAGDLWADVVIGQNDFGHNSIRKTDAHSVQRPSGMVIDRAGNRTYIADGNRNRILGFNRILGDPSQPADIVIGQPGFEDHSAGNGDSTRQTYPYLTSADADSLRFSPAGQVSVTETDCFTSMAVDDEGNLYVADLFNNRVLRYDNPFAGDVIADRVWGQGDYSGAGRNRGSDHPANNGFAFDDWAIPAAGVDLDGDGNLWVTDIGNHRVLRFPRVGGEIAGEADLVLGQPDFQTKNPGTGPAELTAPCDVEIDPIRRLVYVCDRRSDVDSRILVFREPFGDGMAAYDHIAGSVTDPENFIYQLELDSRTHGLWIRYRFGNVELVDLETREAVVSIAPDFEGPIAVDGEGNLFIASRSFWSGDVCRYDYPQFTAGSAVFPAQQVFSADTLGQLMGAAIFGDQLIITDHCRVVIYNDYRTLDSGQAADDVWGQETLDGVSDPYTGFRFPAADSRGKLWLLRQIHGDTHLLAFNYPLSGSSVPIRDIPIAGEHFGPLITLPILGGGEIAIAYWGFMDFALDPTGNRIWLVDGPNNRVVRITGINPGEQPRVDIILGQGDTGGRLSNMGRIWKSWIEAAWGLSTEEEILALVVPPGPGDPPHPGERVFDRWEPEADVYRYRDILEEADIRALASTALEGEQWRVEYSYLGYAGSLPLSYTLSQPQYVYADAEGNLFVSDSGGEGGNTNMRILQWDAASIPRDPPAAVFALPADRVFGTGEDFTITGDQSNDPICQPNKVAVGENGIMVAGMNPYGYCQRFPLVYLDPLNDQLPQFALGDITSRGEVPFFDPEGNLYVTDQCWNRILIYHQPFQEFLFTPSPTPFDYRTPTPIPSPSATPSIMITPSPSPSAEPGVTPAIVKCFRVTGRVVDEDTGAPIPGAAVRAACPDRQGTLTFADSGGRFEAEVCTCFPDGTVRALARRPGFLPGSAGVSYSDWADEEAVDAGDLGLKAASVSYPGVSSGSYSGGGMSDVAVFRPPIGLWAVRGETRFYFGEEGDIPVPADYTGDGIVEAAVFRPSVGLWAVRGETRWYFGGFEDVPAPGDYSGTGTASPGIYRPAAGLWAVRGVSRAYFGSRHDQPVPGDYAGAGHLSPAVFRSLSGLWALRGASRFYFGAPGDLLVPGDYDGRGLRAAGIFRPASGLWAARGLTRVYFGRRGDRPVPADYRGAGLDGFGIFRESGGFWALRGLTRFYFGREGDLPVTR